MSDIKINRETVLPMTGLEFARVCQGKPTLVSGMGDPRSLFQCAFAAVRFGDGRIVVVDDFDQMDDEEIVAKAREAL